MEPWTYKPDEDVKEDDSTEFPHKVLYCDVCTLQAELCDTLKAKQFKQCKPWLIKHAKSLYPDLTLAKPKTVRKRNKGTFVRWPEIRLFHNVRIQHSEDKTTIPFRGKIKLHGTNASVTVQGPKKFAYFQSRNKFISYKQDNHGFEKFAKSKLKFWKGIMDTSKENLTIFGEWCGKGIMRGAAICDIDKNVFAIFSIQVGDKLIINPDRIKVFLGDALDEYPDVIIIPFFTEPINICMADEDKLQETANKINKIVDGVESNDPFVKDTFGVSGTGEGLVWYPCVEDDDGFISKEYFSKFVFKTKGTTHAAVKQQEAMMLNPVITKHAEEYAQIMATEARLQQGLEEGVKGDLSSGSMRSFLNWLWNDIKKEGKDELEASNLTWGAVKEPIMQVGRKWFLKKQMTSSGTPKNKTDES